MGDKWKEYKIGDIGRIITGKTPPTAEPENYGGILPFITPSDMKGQKYINVTERTISVNGIKYVKNLLIPPKTVFVSCIGSDMGKVGMTKVESVTNQQINSIIVNEGIAPDYVYYNLFSRKDELQRLATSGSAQPILNKGHFSQLKINLPPLPEQKAIASILGAMDDKIELNMKMNETLEAMARAIFKSSFTYPFEGLKHILKGEGELQLVDSLLGKIPKGWRVGTLNDLCEIVMGQSPPGETYNETGEGLPFYQGIRDFGFRFPSMRISCNAPTRLAQKGDVLLSVRAPVGSLNIASEKCAIGRGVASLRINGQHYGFLYYLMKETQWEWEKYEAEGTVFGSATKTDIQKFSIIIPPVELISSFNNTVFSLDETIKNNETQSRTLASIRDALLPKLLSGEIRVKDAERFAEDRA